MGFKLKKINYSSLHHPQALDQKIWDTQGEEHFCYFMELKKRAFDIVPKDKLWTRMEELKVLIEFRVVVYRLDEKVRGKNRTSERMLDCFQGSDVSVEQGCLVSPTLFGEIYQ